MHDLFIKVKGIIQSDNQFLILKRWVDDRIPDPFVWEFIESDMEKGESPEEAILRSIREMLGVEGRAESVLYTWSQMIGDIQCVGIAYQCTVEEKNAEFILPEDYGGYAWVDRKVLGDYIENRYMINDLKKAGIIND